jgi:hypothetical protein
MNYLYYLAVNKKLEKDSMEFLMHQNASSLDRIRNMQSGILNVTKDVIKSKCTLPDDDKLDQFYGHLEKLELLEPYIYKIWRLDLKLDCRPLPLCIADQVDEFLADRFAYSFALEKICYSLEEANKDLKPIASQIFLPENPFPLFLDDLISSGIAIPSRICVSTETIEDIDYDDFNNVERIKAVINQYRLKLHDQIGHHMELVSYITYMQEQGFVPDTELNSIANSGFNAIVRRRQGTNATRLLHKTIASVAYLWNKIETCANAVSSFCHSISKSVTGKKFLNLLNCWLKKICTQKLAQV